MSPTKRNSPTAKAVETETEAPADLEVAEATPPAPEPKPDLKGVKVIENHRYADIWLPPNDALPDGKRLKPGLNNVPKAYLHMLETTRVKNRVKDDEAVTYRYPGKLLLESLLRPVRISHLTDGDYFGPSITIYEVDQLGPKGVETDENGVLVEGPPPPITLATANYDIGTARRIISMTRDLAALRRWEKERGQKPEVVEEIQKRIGMLGG